MPPTEQRHSFTQHDRGAISARNYVSGVVAYTRSHTAPSFSIAVCSMTEARSLHSAMLLPWLQQQNGITKQERVTHVIQRATAVLGVRSYKRTVRVDAIRVVTNHFEECQLWQEVAQVACTHKFDATERLWGRVVQVDVIRAGNGVKDHFQDASVVARGSSSRVYSQV